MDRSGLFQKCGNAGPVSVSIYGGLSMNVAINGLGRIGRATLKQVPEDSRFNLVGLNDLISADNLACLTNGERVCSRLQIAALGSGLLQSAAPQHGERQALVR